MIIQGICGGVAKFERITIDELAKNINDYFWYRRQVSEGARGLSQFTRRQVLGSRGSASKDRMAAHSAHNPEKLAMRRATQGLKTLVWLSGRWAIEQCFEETKGELGMEHYEVRKFRGSPPYANVHVAHFFPGT